MTVKTAEWINKKERRINKHFQSENYKYDQLQEYALNDWQDEKRDLKTYVLTSLK